MDRKVVLGLSLSSVILVAVVAAVLLLPGAFNGPSPDAVSQNVSSQDPCRHPCPRYAYEIVYYESDGSLGGALGWDASSPDSVEPGHATNPRAGQAVLVITGNDLVGELFEIGPDAFYVDLETTKLRRRPDWTPLPTGPSPGVTPTAPTWGP